MNAEHARLACGLCLAIWLVGLSSQSSAFNTLLTSPVERALLDKQRQNVGLSPSSDRFVETIESNKMISFEGLVTRQNGPSSIWLNGQLQEKPGAGVSQAVHGKVNIKVKLSSDNRAVWLRPGQFLRTDNGELSDVYQHETKQLQTTNTVETIERVGEQSVSD